jgi:mannose-6-phosphate isomerase-like protein (cupin superfamily)
LFRLARVFGLTATDLLSLVEHRSAHRVKGSGYRTDGFGFRTVSYGNVRLFFGDAAKGARTHRPEIHHDDYETCWVLEGAVEVTLPREKHVLRDGDALQFDAVLEHTYRALLPSRLVIAHITKAKRF